MADYLCGAYFSIDRWISRPDVGKSYFYFESWNTLSHLNTIGLTHIRHSQIIVEVNTPFTSLYGYLTDVNSGCVVRKPLVHSLFPTPLGMLCTRPRPKPPPSPQQIASATVSFPSPLSTLAPRITAQCLCEGVWTLWLICGHTWGWKGKNSQNC